MSKRDDWTKKTYRHGIEILTSGIMCIYFKSVNNYYGVNTVSSLPKIHVYPELQNMPLCGNRVFADVIV